MDYTKASDFEINKALAIKNGLLVAGIDDSKAIGMTTKYHEEYPSTVWCAKTDGKGTQIEAWQQINYCESWEDMGPIIEREKISITFRSRGEKDLPPQAKRFASDDHNIADKNPLRAAAIVYLMMGV